MSEVTLVRTERRGLTEDEKQVVSRVLFGLVDGADDADRKSWRRFWRRLVSAQCGEVFHADFWIPRNARLHRRHFAMLKAVFDAQDRFTDFGQFRAWVAVGAGHVDYVAGPDGAMVALPRSISYRALDDAGFEEHHAAAIGFLLTDYSARTLWPAMTKQGAREMVEAVMGDWL